MEKVLVFLSILQFSMRHVFTQQDTYRAAVLEYAPKLAGTPADRIRTNTAEYILQMEQAARQGAQIIVFPEDGLSGWDIPRNKLDQISTFVPEPTDHTSPCDLYRQNSPGSSNYSKFFVDLSCAARKNRIYTVVNVIEWRREEKNHKKIYHNTNIAFDRDGLVIARYRKINLYVESDYAPGNDTDDALSTFKTDFGVTFGMFISYDILFENPGLDILDNPSVTDIAYSAVWFSELPFLGANSVQHGYAKSNGVNLLAAGLNGPTARNGGSGIYLADGRIAETYVSGARGSKLIIQNIPKHTTRKNFSNTCQGASQAPFQMYHSSDISLFKTKASNLNHYTFKSLNLDDSEISETICAGKTLFCCSFNITVNKGPRPNYTYKLVAFHGASKLHTVNTIGVRNCGLVACLNKDDRSCGERHSESPTVFFEKISIKGIFDNDAHDQPSTLNFDLKPSTDYMYCTKTSNNKVEISLSTTKPHDSLLTFGLFGRTFHNDDEPEGSINGATFKIPNVYICVISIFVFLQQE